MQLSATHPNMIPGMRDKRVEFYSVEGGVECMHNGRNWTYSEFPAFMRAIIQNDMLQNPELVCKINDKWMNEAELMETYIATYFGRLDGVADIDEHGKVNRELNPFSCAELKVLQLGHLPDKLIADRLFIQKCTVEGHWKRMRNKTGLTNKVELAMMAVKYDLI